MPRRTHQIIEGPIEFPLTQLEAVRERHRQEFGHVRGETLREWAGRFKKECEHRLYVFCKYVLGMKDMTPELHGRTADWLQDMNPATQHVLSPRLTARGGRYKLLMLPVVHLKTSIASHGFPLHVLIQPKGGLYFPEMSGQDCRILLHGETVDKAKENLAVVAQHLETNAVLRGLWPHLMWLSRKEATLWQNDAITVKRTGEFILAEPSVTSIGLGTALEQRHYNVIIIDDLATQVAAESELRMEGAKARRIACRYRLDNPTTSIEIGVGTHWTSTDIYMDWRRDPEVEVCIRAAIEEGEPIWPQRWPLEKLYARQNAPGIGARLFSANFMNNPLNATFSALDWDEVRSFTFLHSSKELLWTETPVDEELEQRASLAGLINADLYALHGRNFRGLPLDQLYTNLRQIEPPNPEELHRSRMARLRKQIDREDEGSNMRTRLEEIAIRRQKDWEQRQ